MTDKLTRAEAELVAQVARELLGANGQGHGFDPDLDVDAPANEHWRKANVRDAFATAKTWLAERKRLLAEAEPDPTPARLPTDGARRG